MSLSQAPALQNPQEADQGSLKGELLREGETSEQVALVLAKAPWLPLGAQKGEIAPGDPRLYE